MDLNANFLLGRGEKLTSTVDVPSSGGPKNPPYTFEQAKGRLAPQVASATSAFHQLPAAACPDNEAVAVVTLHPRYISKSDHPAKLLRAVGLRSVGSRPTRVSPDEWGIQKHPDDAVTTDLFVAGPRTAFDAWSDLLPRWQPDSRFDELVQLEHVRPHVAAERMRSIPQDGAEHLFEVVLHTGRRQSIVDAFAEYARGLGAAVDLDRRREIRGLCFVPVTAPTAIIGDLAKFTMMRVVRGMPKLRPLRPGILRGAGGFQALLPDLPALETSPRVAVFDGGLPDHAGLDRWVQVIDGANVGPPVADFQAHGLQVTSALLFGPLAAAETAAQPYCTVDHYRVLGEDTFNETEDLYDVLARISGVLAAHRHRYHFVNLSIGPDLAVEDDDVHVWTATLDAEFARADVLAVVAVGNNGEMDSAAGLDRIQPPSDAINVLAVGACDSVGEHWSPAAYSSRGPGRSPGVVKPDGLAFGGGPGEPFYMLATAGGKALPDQGTSFAAPTVLRAATAVRALLGPDLSPLALRALLVHRAGRGDHDVADAGWGRFETDPTPLVTSADHAVHIVYQGQLPVGTYLRAPIPLPPDELEGMVLLRATLCIAPEVDPEHAVTYTRAGVEIRFRPHSERFNINQESGEPSAHPRTDTFFSQSLLYPNEFSLRDDGHKWEPVLSAEKRKRASSLKEPCFDLYCHQREAGEAASVQPELPYALVVTIAAPRVKDLYNQVVRAYRVLQPLRPVVRIPIRT